MVVVVFTGTAAGHFTNGLMLTCRPELGMCESLQLRNLI